MDPINPHTLAARKYRSENREQYNAQRRKYAKAYRMKMRQEAIDALGGKCAHCGIADIRVLQIDHIDGDGKVDRARSGGYQYYRRMLDNIESFQVLCANCHAIKTHHA